MSTSAIQDLYPDDLAHCFGCGRNNPHGYRLNSYAEGPNLVAHFTPEPHYVSIPGFVYGGLLASLADCHAMATATAADLAESRSKAQGKKLLRLRYPRRERLQYVPTLWQCIYLKQWNNRQRQDDEGSRPIQFHT